MCLTISYLSIIHTLSFLIYWISNAFIICIILGAATHSIEQIFYFFQINWLIDWTFWIFIFFLGVHLSRLLMKPMKLFKLFTIINTLNEYFIVKVGYSLIQCWLNSLQTKNAAIFIWHFHLANNLLDWSFKLFVIVWSFVSLTYVIISINYIIFIRFLPSI